MLRWFESNPAHKFLAKGLISIYIFKKIIFYYIVWLNLLVREEKTSAIFLRLIFINNNFYKPTILIMMAYKTAINNTNPIITKRRSFLILNKFLNGAKITKIKPAKLLIKKRG